MGLFELCGQALHQSIRVYSKEIPASQNSHSFCFNFVDDSVGKYLLSLCLAVVHKYQLKMFELLKEVNHLVSLCVSRIFGGVFNLCILLYKCTTNLNSRTDFSLFEFCTERTFCGIAREVDKRISPGQILWNIHLCRAIRSHARSGKDNLSSRLRHD